ncbi:MAG: GNAT family N-acetyltransferase [Flavobacteriaceae bacterium]
MEFIVNQDKKRFELHTEDRTAFIDYILNNQNIMFLTHTEVPKELGGKGIGKILVQNTLEYLKTNGHTLAPVCPFVAAYVKKNPEWKEILAQGYSVQ